MAFGSGRSSACILWFDSVMGRTGIQGSARFQVVTGIMVDGLIIIGSVGIIRYVNPACGSIFQYREGALIGRNVPALMPSPFFPMRTKAISRAIGTTGGKGIVGLGRELRSLKSDGTIFPMYLSVGEAIIAGEIIRTQLRRRIAIDLTQGCRTMIKA